MHRPRRWSPGPCPAAMKRLLLRAQAEAYGASHQLTLSIDLARLSSWRADLVIQNLRQECIYTES